MIKYAILILVAISFMIVPAFAEIELSEQTSGAVDNLNSIHVINSTHTWAVGDEGILISNDGGSNWQLRAGFNENLNAIFFSDELTGVIVGDGYEGFGQIRRTMDGGGQWLGASSEITVSDIKDVFFITNNEGWIVGSDGLTAKTFNGGNSWAINIFETSTINSVHFVDDTYGWATSGNSVLHTTNGGQNWTSVSAVFEDALDVFFIDKNIGFVVGNSEIAKSTDGGQTWTSIDMPFTVDGNLNSIHFIDANIGVAVGEQGIILSTRDGGNTWDLDILEGNNLNDVFFIDENNGFVVGDEGFLASFALENNIGPEITLDGDSTITISLNQTYEDPVVTCIDNYDGNISGNIVISGDVVDTTTLGTYVVVYDCDDSAGNPADTITRTVNVELDEDIPIIALEGDSTVYHKLGTEYEDLGATCEDPSEGIISVIIDDSEVIIGMAGPYTVYFDCDDSVGNSATETRTVIVDGDLPAITLDGDNMVDVEVFDIYEDLGATCDDLSEGEIDDNVIIDDIAVNTEELATYTVYFDCSDSAGNDAPQQTRTVNVVDTTPPVITLNGDSTVYHQLGTKYTDLGSTCTDNYDGNIPMTTLIDVNTEVLGTNTILFSCTDSAGNPPTQVTRTVIVVNTMPPVITLLGANPQIIIQYEEYVELNATCIDNSGSDISVNLEIAIDGVFTEDIGTYDVFYNCDDLEGNSAIEVIREVQVVAEIITPDEPVKKKSSGGCWDCTPPTLGFNQNNKQIVDNGFVYNGNAVQVERWHTPYPLINATVGEMNLVEIKVYENNGINNMRWVQFGLGAEEIGMPLNSLEVLIEVKLAINSTGMGVDEIVINDKDNLIDNETVAADVYEIECSVDGPTCLKVDLQYSYREETFNHIMVVQVVDKPGNSQNFWLNDGVRVVGESLNPTPTYSLSNRMTSQQTENLYLTLTRTDKINHLWTDDFGVEYLQISENRFDRLTPEEKYSCAADDIVIKSVNNRNNICQFLPLINDEITRAENTMNDMYLSYNYDTIQEWNHNNKAYSQYESSQ